MDNTPKFDGFEILETLPRGGMSTVYKARQISLDRVVALKSLPPNLVQDPSDIENFIHEAQITASLKHTNIVQVYDFGKTADGIYYFVMEFVSGYSVAHWIRRKQQISEDNVLLIAQSVADALNYAWEDKRIIHCDVKPDNIMIDSDGSIKVADLGLAKSIQSAAADDQSDSVFGTPNYIAPEQSRGDTQLDCRTDIYALGATLYHCLTGQMPFETLPPLEVMDKQITDTIPDPQVIRPNISTACACLVEKMMSKEPDARQADWNAVIKDIARVRANQLPQGNFSQIRPSTVERSAARSRQLANKVKPKVVAVKPSLHPTAKPRKQANKSFKLFFATLFLLLTAIMAAWFVRSGCASQSSALEDKQIFFTEPDKQDAQSRSFPIRDSNPDEYETAARQAYHDALQWLAGNPSDYKRAVKKFQKVADQAVGTQYAALALEEIDKILQTKEREIHRLMNNLDDQAEQLAKRHQYDQAIAVFSDYKGEFIAETAEKRQMHIQELRDRAEKYRQTAQTQLQPHEEQWQEFLEKTAEALLKEDFKTLAELMFSANLDDHLAVRRNSLRELEDLIKAVQNIDSKLLATFSAQKNQAIDLQLTGGTEKLTIREVSATSVLAEKIFPLGSGYVSQPRSITVADLALPEKLKRLGTSDAPATVLQAGILAMRDYNFDAAERSLDDLQNFLGNPLRKVVSRQRQIRREQEAWKEIASLLTRFQVKIKPVTQSLTNVAEQLKAQDFSPWQQDNLRQSIEVFQVRYKGTDCAEEVKKMWQASSLTPSAQIESDIQREMYQQKHNLAEALKVSLLNYNPGLQPDEIVLQVDDYGQPVRLEIISPNLRSLQPLSNLTSVQKLICGGMRASRAPETILLAPLDDLKPLRNLPLEVLYLGYTRVNDLSPLSGMRTLKRLSLTQTDVSDITPLANLSLVALDLSNSKARALYPLLNMPLQKLNLSHTQATDFSVLRGMPLVSLKIAQTRFRDLTLLKNMPLNLLDAAGTSVWNLRPLQGMPLEWLSLADTPIEDIAWIEGMPLKDLDISHTKVKNIKALRGMPLRSLNIKRTAIKDLSPLQDVPIEEIWLDYQPFLRQRDTDRVFFEVLHLMPALISVNDNPWQQQEPFYYAE